MPFSATFLFFIENTLYCIVRMEGVIFALGNVSIMFSRYYGVAIVDEVDLGQFIKLGGVFAEVAVIRSKKTDKGHYSDLCFYQHVIWKPSIVKIGEKERMVRLRIKMDGYEKN